MKWLFVCLLVSFEANSELISNASLEARLSDSWKKFDEKIRQSPEQKKMGNPSAGYSIDFCSKEKEEFTACDMAYCIIKSKREATEHWLKAAQENMNGTCYLPDIEESFRSRLNIIKDCVIGLKRNGKLSYRCKLI